MKLPCDRITVLLPSSICRSEVVDFSWQELFLFLCTKDVLNVSGYCASRS